MKVARAPVLFLHGFFGSPNDGASLQDYLRKDNPRLRFFAPTLPGHDTDLLEVNGDSSNDSCGNFRSEEGLDVASKVKIPATSQGEPKAWQGWIDHEIDSLFKECGQSKVRGRARVHLVGYSLGGRLALDYALTFPEKVQSLTLVSASPGIESEALRASRAILDAERAASLRTNGIESFLTTWYSMALFDSLRDSVGLSALVALRSAGRSQKQANALATLLENLSPGRWPSHWKNLSTRSFPLLYLLGEKDPAYVTQALRLMNEVQDRGTDTSGSHDRQERNEGCQLLEVHQLPGKGHALLLEAPAACAQHMTKFWTSIEETRP